MTPTEIASETVTSAPGTTKRVKRLVDAGLVRPRTNPRGRVRIAAIDHRRSAVH